MQIVSPVTRYLAGGSDYDLQRVFMGFKQCYSQSIVGLENAPREVMEEFIAKMRKGCHESPLEHASYTFQIVCSRDCSHQIVRHRLATYSQQSQRYVKFDDLPVILPDIIKNDSVLLRGVEMHIKEAESMYKHFMASENVKAEDARYILPGCTATQIVMTMNARSWLHFIEERCCNRAQWEVRQIANEIRQTLEFLTPCIFKGAGPKCKRIGHCPESKPCGARPWGQHE